MTRMEHAGGGEYGGRGGKWLRGKEKRKKCSGNGPAHVHVIRPRAWEQVHGLKQEAHPLRRGARRSRPPLLCLKFDTLIRCAAHRSSSKSTGCDSSVPERSADSLGTLPDAVGRADWHAELTTYADGCVRDLGTPRDRKST